MCFAFVNSISLYITTFTALPTNADFDILVVLADHGDFSTHLDPVVTRFGFTMTAIVTGKRNDNKIHVSKWNLHRKAHTEKID